jgi:hypothetical protein
MPFAAWMLSRQSFTGSPNLPGWPLWQRMQTISSCAGALAAAHRLGIPIKRKIMLKRANGLFIFRLS